MSFEGNLRLVVLLQRVFQRVKQLFKFVVYIKLLTYKFVLLKQPKTVLLLSAVQFPSWLRLETENR